jgi:putative transposase
MKQKHKIWQDEYHPVAITSEKWFRHKMEYMHNNPVQKGFVERSEDWKYGS